MAAGCKPAAPWSYGGSNPPLCTRRLVGVGRGVTMAVAGARRKGIALAGLAIVAVLAWSTMDPGKVRLLVMILLGGFALRVALTHDRSRYDEEDPPEQGR